MQIYILYRRWFLHNDVELSVFSSPRMQMLKRCTPDTSIQALKEHTMLAVAQTVLRAPIGWNKMTAMMKAIDI